MFFSRPSDRASHVEHTAVAIFHASFHPTQGHVVDWSLKASDGWPPTRLSWNSDANNINTDLNLDNVEFSALPSGLHLVDQDVVYDFYFFPSCIRV